MMETLKSCMTQCQCAHEWFWNIQKYGPHLTITILRIHLKLAGICCRKPMNLQCKTGCCRSGAEDGDFVSGSVKTQNNWPFMHCGIRGKAKRRSGRARHPRNLRRGWRASGLAHCFLAPQAPPKVSPFSVLPAIPPPTSSPLGPKKAPFIWPL